MFSSNVISLYVTYSVYSDIRRNIEFLDTWFKRIGKDEQFWFDKEIEALERMENEAAKELFETVDKEIAENEAAKELFEAVDKERAEMSNV